MDKVSLKEKVKSTKEKISSKVAISEDTSTIVKPLVTCRILFVSALDKIYLVILLLQLVGIVLSLLRGMPFTMFLASLVGLVIEYLLLNWFYKCAIKTMLCVTDKEVYKESYIPFKRTETSIPLNKITKVTTIDIIWIFRLVIIHQYNHIPMFFWTWNSHEFKDVLSKKIGCETTKVENEFKTRGIISKKSLNWLKWVAIVLVAIIILYYVWTGIASLFSPARKVPGTYVNDTYSFVLNRNNTCDLSNMDSDVEVTKCEWEYDEDYNEVEIDYDYKYKYSWSSTYYEDSSSFTFDYDKDAKTLTYAGTVYTKK